MNYEKFLIALCLWREARNQTMPAMRAIYHVIQNRVADPRWPNSAVEVILQPKQFSSFNAGDPNAVIFPTPRRVSDWDAFQRALIVVDEALPTDPTDGANHYEACPPDKVPSWADPSKMMVQIGMHRFYKL